MNRNKWIHQAGISFMSGAIALAACSLFAGAQPAPDAQPNPPAQEDPPPPPGHRMPPPRVGHHPDHPDRPDRPAVSLAGTVQSFNLNPDGRHGEINGALLDSGDQVRFPPDAIIAQKLETGQKLSADGRSHSMLNGHQTVEADSINGKAIEPPRSPHDHERGMERHRGPDREPMRGPGAGERHQQPPPPPPDGQ